MTLFCLIAAAMIILEPIAVVRGIRPVSLDITFSKQNLGTVHGPQEPDAEETAP